MSKYKQHHKRKFPLRWKVLQKKNPKQPPKLWGLKPACQNFVTAEGKSASSLALPQISSTFKFCFEWGPTQWRWQVILCLQWWQLSLSFHLAWTTAEVGARWARLPGWSPWYPPTQLVSQVTLFSLYWSPSHPLFDASSPPQRWASIWPHCDTDHK